MIQSRWLRSWECKSLSQWDVRKTGEQSFFILWATCVVQNSSKYNGQNLNCLRFLSL